MAGNPTGQTDFTGIVNAVQTMTQMLGQNNKAIGKITAAINALPAPSAGIALDMVRVNAGGTAYEARTPAQVYSDLGLILPTPAVGNALDMIRVNAAGTAYEVRTPAQVVSDLGLSNAVPVGASNSTTGTTVSATTPTFTAPSAGALVIIAFGSGASATSASLTTSLAGLVTLFTSFSAGSHSNAFGYLPMAATNSSTATYSFTVGSSVPINANVMAFFLPQA